MVDRLKTIRPRPAAEGHPYFEDAAAYEEFMGVWSRAAGLVFLDWIAVPMNSRWLDVGCGTGVFTRLIVDTMSPSSVSAVDPTQAQIDHARRQAIGEAAHFQIADARALPFASNTFDAVVAALVMNFIDERSKALAEMRRVGRAGATVAAYVWDFAGQRDPGALLRTGLRSMGIDLAEVPGTADSGIDALRSLFERAGLDAIATKAMDVTLSFRDFDHLWRAQTLNCGPRAATVASLSGAERAELMDKLRASLPVGPAGSVSYSARAHAIQARVPAKGGRLKPAAPR
jgi:SAM-dependent methyltransferase